MVVPYRKNDIAFVFLYIFIGNFSLRPLSDSFNLVPGNYIASIVTVRLILCLSITIDWIVMPISNLMASLIGRIHISTCICHFNKIIFLKKFIAKRLITNI